MAQAGEFAFRAAALRFNPVRGGYRFEMSFAMPLASLTIPHKGVAQKVRLHAVFLALIKDASGPGGGKGQPRD
jgi:hypothetical protein